jgi:hemolysin III
MTRTKLADRILPTYTKGEEIFNTVSHILGAILGIVATVLCIIQATKNNNVYGIVSGTIYGISMIILYTMSSVYHALNPKRTSKKVLQILDHCSIFLLIAGSYTPFSLCTLRNYSIPVGWTIFGIIWLIAIIGITLNAIDLKKYKKFSMICYLVMGWCIILKAYLLPNLLTMNGFILLLSGGIVYSIGAIFYGVGKRCKYMHSIFHLFILAGSLLQFFCILFFVM